MPSLLKGNGIVFFDPENFTETEHRIGIEAGRLEQSFVTDGVANPLVFRGGPNIEPCDRRRQRLAMGIDWHD